jgi:hypothetical protein
MDEELAAILNAASLETCGARGHSTMSWRIDLVSTPLMP